MVNFHTYSTLKIAPQCPMHQEVETTRGPMHRRVETLRGPMHWGITKVELLDNPKWSYAPGSRDSLGSYALESCDSLVSYVQGSHKSETKIFTDCRLLCYLQSVKISD